MQLFFMFFRYQALSSFNSKNKLEVNLVKGICHKLIFESAGGSYGAGTRQFTYFYKQDAPTELSRNGQNS